MFFSQLNSRMIRLFLPAILISTTSALCPNLKSSGASVPFRPPGWIFAVVWPLLYMTTGYAWIMSEEDNLFALVIGLCCSWLILYSCKENKTIAAYILFASAIASWYLVWVLKGSISMYFMLPLAFWLSFATTINVYEIQS